MKYFVFPYSVLLFSELFAITINLAVRKNIIFIKQDIYLLFQQLIEVTIKIKVIYPSNSFGILFHCYSLKFENIYYCWSCIRIILILFTNENMLRCFLNHVRSIVRNFATCWRLFRWSELSLHSYVVRLLRDRLMALSSSFFSQDWASRNCTPCPLTRRYSSAGTPLLYNMSKQTGDMYHPRIWNRRE